MPEPDSHSDDDTGPLGPLPTPRISQMPVSILNIRKNRSEGNLLASSGDSGENTRIRFSIDEGVAAEHDPMARSPALQEHDHLAVSGLRRIRQQPQSRASSRRGSPELSFTSPTRSSSMTLDLPSPRRFSGPTSPSMNFSEDLSRFPSESLHSFSFTHQSEDGHHRQNILKRSIEFMRDRLGGAANHPGILSAQAKISGDTDIQSMMELLARANVQGNDIEHIQGSRLLHGPLTGPADIQGENVFEKTFLPKSLIQLDRIDQSISQHEDNGLPISSPDYFDSSLASEVPAPDRTDPQSPLSGSLGPDTLHTTSDKTGLKRTYTDVSLVSLQNRLMDALARPYATRESLKDNQLTSQMPTPAFGRSLNSNVTSVVHGHANRWAPAAQAIFTTEAHAPWTILAANDLACLVFGVTKAEVRKLGILEVVREDRRDWLEERLKLPGSEAAAKARNSNSRNQKSSASTLTSAATRKGVTAQLLSKPPSRNATNQRAKTDDGSGSTFSKKAAKGASHHVSNKSRGVLLCGDVVPIRKRNGVTGSASLWVKEKRASLIWVLEEITEDVAYLDLDAEGHVLSTRGANEILWGQEKFIPGTDVRKLIPYLPNIPNSAEDTVDFGQTNRIQHFGVQTTDGVNIPASISADADLRSLRVSSFPHIAGILVLSSTTLEITSSNSVFSAALFGQENPDGLAITQLIPQFDQILEVLTEEDKVSLVDGIVIPEHSFRRARALLALRSGSADATTIFLHPTALVAKHRDGSKLNIDVQMRVVKSESVVESVIEEKSESEDDITAGKDNTSATSKVVYALWIAYSRQLHSTLRHGDIGSPLISSPATPPPQQPSPGQRDLSTSPQPIDPEDNKSIMSPNTFLTQQIQEATSQPISDEPVQNPPIGSKSAVNFISIPKKPKKRVISEFVILEEMGQGAYGQVKLARYHNNSGKKVVLKYVTKRRILVDTWTRDRRLGTVPLEIHVLDYLRKDGLRHPNIVEMIDFFEDDINYYIEMVPHGLPGMDLFDYIEMRSTMEEAECRTIFRQVVAALHHLHTKALVVHRDIKDENIVLDGEHKVKLIDFGSAAYIKNGPFDVFVGTIDYAAPEVLQGKSYRGKEQDVWALGILLYTLVYKENPFYNIDEIIDHELRIPWIMSDASIDLIKAMLTREVDQRLTITQVMEHPWCRLDADDNN